ncbi:MAG: ACT domain-containing protein [Bacteroidota bacterium]
MRLRVVPGPVAVCRLSPEATVEPWMWTGPLASVTRTADEMSVVCSPEAVPEGVRCEAPWRALVVEGPLDFALTGVLASLAGPLAEAGIPIFVVSTFDTDWLLVRADRLEAATEALRACGHRVAPEASGG